MEINHRKDYSTLVVHEDFIAICGGNLCKALILSVLEKVISRQEDAFVPLNTSDFMQEMYGLYRRDSTIESVTSLVESGLIERRQLPYTDKKHVFEYRINAQTVQEMIDSLPDKVELNRLSPLPKELPKPLFNLLKEFSFLCAYCQDNQSTTWDHIIARSKGGSEDITNIVPACRVCNVSKSNKDVLTWMKSLSYTPSAALLKKFEVLGIEVQ